MECYSVEMKVDSSVALTVESKVDKWVGLMVAYWDYYLAEMKADKMVDLLVE